MAKKIDEELVTMKLCDERSNNKKAMIEDFKHDMGDIKDKLDRFIEVITIRMNTHDVKVDTQDKKIDRLTNDLQKISGEINKINISVGEIKGKLIADSDELKQECHELRDEVEEMQKEKNNDIFSKITNSKDLFLMACIGIAAIIILSMATGNFIHLKNWVMGVI